MVAGGGGDRWVVVVVVGRSRALEVGVGPLALARIHHNSKLASGEPRAHTDYGDEPLYLSPPALTPSPARPVRLASLAEPHSPSPLWLASAP